MKFTAFLIATTLSGAVRLQQTSEAHGWSRICSDSDGRLLPPEIYHKSLDIGVRAEFDIVLRLRLVFAKLHNC